MSGEREGGYGSFLEQPIEKTETVFEETLNHAQSISCTNDFDYKGMLASG